MVKKNAILRYKIIDTLLTKYPKRYKMEDLVRRVNEALEFEFFEPVSRRCIEKDLAMLKCSPYNAPIESKWIEGDKFVMYAEEGFSIFTSKLSEDEENILSEVLNTLGQFDGLDTFDWLDGLKKRLGIKEHRRIIAFDSNPYLTGKKLIGSLFTAISNKQVISLNYHSIDSTESKVRIVNPYLLKEYNNRWYLIAGYKDGTIRNFALDRIQGFKILDKLTYIEPDDNLEERFDDIVGITLPLDKPIEKILFWVDEKGYRYIDTKPLHHSQSNVTSEEDAILREKYPALKGGRFFRLKCIINYELRQQIMSRMEQIVVLAPLSLSEQIRNSVKILEAYYDKI